MKIKQSGNYLLVIESSGVLIVCYDDFSFVFNKDDQDKKVETLMAPSKKQESLPLHQETKQESGSGKKKVSSRKQKTENGEMCR